MAGATATRPLLPTASGQPTDSPEKGSQRIPAATGDRSTTLVRMKMCFFLSPLNHLFLPLEESVAASEYRNY